MGERRERPKGWPTLPAAALHGPIGSFVRDAAPHTEADEAALLVTALAFFGGSIGRGPHVEVGNTQHAARIFPVIVGGTASGAKGTSVAPPRHLFEKVDAELTGRMLSGFGSGEALVDAVADPDPDDPDSGSRDGRLVVVESEFARVLRAAGRDGSTLSMTIRDAWDGSTLQARSRARTSVASKAHVVLVGHITPEELRVRLSDTESYSGFSNRLLLVLSARSKLLHEGGNVPEEVFDRYAGELRDAIRGARKRSRVERTPAASTRWKDLYRELADDQPGGLLEATIARGAPYVLRLSLLYALASGARRIDVEHLEAAWSLWRYSRASAQILFEDRQADPMAEKVRIAVTGAGEEGAAKTVIWQAVGRNTTRTHLDAVLKNLIDSGEIAERSEATGGRPRTVYVLTKQEERTKGSKS